MDGSNAPGPSPSGGDNGGFGSNSNGANGANNGRGGNRRLTNMEQHLLAEDNAATAGVGAAGLGGPSGYYGARGALGPGGMGMYGGGDPSTQGAQAQAQAQAAAAQQQAAAQQRLNSIYGAAGLGGAHAGLRGVPGMMPGQFEDPNGGIGGSLAGNVGLAGLQAAQGGLGGLNAMNGLGAAQGLQQQQAAQQRAQMVAQQQAAAGVDFQGLMPTGFEGADASAALLGNPAAMAGYPFQTGFNGINPSAGLGSDGAPGGAGAGLLNVNAAALGGAPGAAMAVAARNVNAQFGQASTPGPGHSLFDQGYQFARSEMALARHQAALSNNAALMGGGGQPGLHLAGLDRQGAAGLRGLGPGGVNPYAQYGADPLMGGAAGPGGVDPYSMSRGGGEGGPSGAQHLATIPAIRLAQHRSALQRRMLVNNLPERKDGSFPVVLYQESDEHKLTAYQCLLRKQLELFEADEDDVRCSTRQGRTAPIKLGQVGLRCRHCAGVQLAARTKGAAYYSQTVEGIYQIAQNMSKVHLCERCYRIPRDVRRQLIVLRSDCRRAIGGKEYWSENIRQLGVYVDEGILRVKKAPKESDATDATKKEEGSEDKKEDDDKKDSSESKDEEMEGKKEDKDEDKAEESKDGDDEKKDDAEATPMDEDKEENTTKTKDADADDAADDDKETKTTDDDKESPSDDKETPKTEEKADDDKDEKEGEDVSTEKSIEKVDSEAAEAKEDKKEEADDKMEDEETTKDDDKMEEDEKKETDEPAENKDAPAAAAEEDKKGGDDDEKKDDDAKEEKATEAKDDEETEDEVEDEKNGDEEDQGSTGV